MENINLSNITTYQAGAAQASAHRALQKLCDQILEPFGITKMQWLILGHVLDAGKQGVRVSDLAGTLATTLPYITTAVNLLESRGYLSRKSNSTDSRSTLLVIMPAFKHKSIGIEAALREGLRQTIYARIDPEEFRVYIKVLYQLDKAAKLNTFQRKHIKRL